MMVILLILISKEYKENDGSERKSKKDPLEFFMDYFYGL